MKETGLTRQSKFKIYDTRNAKVNHADGESSSSAENFLKNLVNTVGKDGVKTDVSITLAPSNFIYMGIAIVTAVVIAWGITYLIKTTFFSKTA